jgi:hypothetical protein
MEGSEAASEAHSGVPSKESRAKLPSGCMHMVLGPVVAWSALGDQTGTPEGRVTRAAALVEGST